MLNLYSTEFFGRTSLHDVYDPVSGELLVQSGDQIREDEARKIEASGIESVEIRSVLTVNLSRVYVLSVTDVTWQQAEWFRKVKLLGLLPHSQSVNLVLSLP
ncbi:MAG: hypothetical protein R2850_02770 [Bacteroidia bacterium]